MRNSRSITLPARFRLGAATLLIMSAPHVAVGQASAPDERPAVAVRTLIAQPTSVATAVTLTGEIRARVQTDLGFPFSGRIRSRAAEVGDHVAAGQVLATLDATQQDADVAAAAAGVQSALALLTQVSASFERQKNLLARGFATQSDFDDVEVALQGAQASLVSARATLATAEDRRAKTELRAPAAGVVTARMAEVGQVVQAAQAVFALAEDGPRDAVFEVYEALLISPPERDRVEVTLLSNPDVSVIGSLRETAPTVDAGTVTVKIGLGSTPPEMRLGAAVSGVGRFRRRDVFALPWTAFFIEDGAPAVWIVDAKSDVASLRRVEIDSYRTGGLLLSAGLAPGEIVVTGGGQLLRPGQVVDPQSGAQPTDIGG